VKKKGPKRSKSAAKSEKTERKVDGTSPVATRVANSINIRIRPVDQTYNCRQNKNKFCLPCGEPSARILEQTFVLERKLEIANRQKNKKKDKINNKQMSLML